MRFFIHPRTGEEHKENLTDFVCRAGELSIKLCERL